VLKLSHQVIEEKVKVKEKEFDAISAITIEIKY
jgi:hypothetical protein